MYVAAVLAPGFKEQVPKSAPGGTFIEGVMWEWMTEGDTTLSSHGAKLPKCPQKVKVFEAICKSYSSLLQTLLGIVLSCSAT